MQAVTASNSLTNCIYGRLEARARRNALISDLPQTSNHKAEIEKLKQEVAFTRSWVHSVCKNINDLRNRVAHHEPLINGFPLNGQNRRMSAAEGHEEIRSLTRMIDRKLATWLDNNSTVQSILQRRHQ